LPVVKVHNTKILTAANSGVLAANNLTGTLSADMFYNLANRIDLVIRGHLMGQMKPCLL
jgi:hypothetical protein